MSESGAERGRIESPFSDRFPPNGEPLFLRHFSILSPASAFSSSVGYASCNIPVPARITSIALRRIEPGNRLLLLAIRAGTGNRVTAHTRKKIKTQKASRKGRKIAYEKLNSTPQSESNLKSQFWR